MKSSAIISECGRYRYLLNRLWEPSKHSLLVCMLNPSTADAEKDDPTIRTLIHFAISWGYGGIAVINLWALRTSSPAAMMAFEDAFGKNADFIEGALRVATTTTKTVLAAWGTHGGHEGRDEWFISRATGEHRLGVIILGKTRDGHPKHPMARGKHRIPRDQQPISWRTPA